MASTNPKYGRKKDGTFAKGHGGRPRGARNKTTQAVSTLLDGEADKLTRKAIELALEGENAALRLCLERILPPSKDAPVSFDLPPMSGANSAAQAMGDILDAVAKGDLTPSEARSLADIVEGYRKALEVTEIEARLRALEEIRA